MHKALSNTRFQMRGIEIQEENWVDVLGEFRRKRKRSVPFLGQAGLGLDQIRGLLREDTTSYRWHGQNEAMAISYAGQCSFTRGNQ